MFLPNFQPSAKQFTLHCGALSEGGYLGAAALF